MALVANEMLQDPAILMTSKNPSLTGSKSRPRHSAGVDEAVKSLMENLQTSAVGQPLQANPSPSTQTGRANKSKSKTPKKRKPKSPKKSQEQQAQQPAVEQQEPAALPVVAVVAKPVAEQENRSPAGRKSSRRDSRPFRTSKKNNNSPKSPKPASKGTGNSTTNNANAARPPLATNTNVPLSSLAQQQQQVVVQAKPHQQHPPVPFRRLPIPPNVYQNNRLMSELNPFAASFVPRYFTKPGVSNEYVSREIFEYYQRNRQTNDQFKGKQTLRQALENTLKQTFPNHVINLYMVGSSTNGIGDNAASVDICIMARKRSAPVLASSTVVAVADAPALPETVATSTTNDVELEVEAASSENSAPIETVPTELTESAAPASSSESGNEMEVDSAKESEEKEDVEETKNKVEAEEESKPEPAQEASEELAHDKAEDVKIEQPTAQADVEMASVEPAVVADEKMDAAEQSPQEEKIPEQESSGSNEAENVAEQPDVVEVVPSASAEAAEEVQELTLNMIETLLKSKNFAKNIVSIPAKVPIIKFKDDIAKLDITLNLNQDVSIRNTQLIRDYAKVDWRFPYLAMVLKQWARENRICSAIDKTISSYSWTLMVIHYLQVCEPPVLPSLQKLMPRRYEQRGNIEQAINNWRRYPTKWRSQNNSNLRQLLKGLFRYYGYVFSYDQQVISVREGKTLDRAAVQTRAGSSDTQWSSFLCIEEPFTRTNTTRSVHDKDKFERIIELFRMSSNALRGVRISLFNVVADDLSFPITY